ncbi:Crp/Fnr family transcriptional regulator [Saccharospirillum impatiens]|uniref:Crp/Fnr family transcriptional regulator n=1 Tax=Saccharospirillum impatiens TaxID=169438 RepID=UPI00040A7EAD|nr:cyclic nucleotide-binding domain-containing protein [Saccharospirillum impatiens]
MFTLVQHPDSWITHTQAHQVQSLKRVSVQPDETRSFSRGALSNADTSNWALVKPVEGVIGLSADGTRLFALESDDCWCGQVGEVLEWFQEGAVTLDIWYWSSLEASVVPHLIAGFNDAALRLALHNSQMPQDPAPGFEFFKSGDVIIREGEPADCVFTLIEGRARVMREGVQLGIAREGEILGLQAMLLHSTRTASVIAEGNCSAVRVDYDKFQHLIASRPELVLSTLETMAKHIERMNDRLLQAGAD